MHLSSTILVYWVVDIYCLIYNKTHFSIFSEFLIIFRPTSDWYTLLYYAIFLDACIHKLPLAYYPFITSRFVGLILLVLGLHIPSCILTLMNENIWVFNTNNYKKNINVIWKISLIYACCFVCSLLLLLCFVLRLLLLLQRCLHSLSLIFFGFLLWACFNSYSCI